MIRKLLASATFIFATLTVLNAAIPVDSTALITTNRADGRFTSTIGTVRSWMMPNQPRLTFRPDSLPDAESLAQWRDSMSVAMTRLMRHPQAPDAPAVKVKTVQRDGYTVEKWETYPLPGSVVPVLVLVPDGVSESNPARGAVLCIPGSGQTKELMAGENWGDYNLELDTLPAEDKNNQALHFVRKGLVAMAVDNPAHGELSDNGRFDVVYPSRLLLEDGWSYLGLASWQDKVALDLLRSRNDYDTSKTVVSGFSLGTEPLMALGLMDPDIYAFVYNDFLCRTRERAFAMTVRDANKNRNFPNNIDHLIPGFLAEFDFPDIVAALAPRPVICTEGGMDRDFGLIAKAFEIAGAPENFEYHHYAKYADPATRQPLERVPFGIDRATFFNLANVDSPRHYYKTEWILPWIDKVLPETPATGK